MTERNACGRLASSRYRKVSFMSKTNRRTFLKAAAATASLVPFSGFPAVVKRRDINSMLSHACVGTGNMAWV